jgi:hypothetical protein
MKLATRQKAEYADVPVDFFSGWASDDGAFITGQKFSVNGGNTLS